MTLPVTSALVAGFLALAIFAGWRGSRPPDFAKGVRLMPWQFIMVTAAAGALFMTVHLVNLLGVHTGR